MMSLLPKVCVHYDDGMERTFMVSEVSSMNDVVVEALRTRGVLEVDPNNIAVAVPLGNEKVYLVQQLKSLKICDLFPSVNAVSCFLYGVAKVMAAQNPVTPVSANSSSPAGSSP
jgi:hypothetical protein